MSPVGSCFPCFIFKCLELIKQVISHREPNKWEIPAIWHVTLCSPFSPLATAGVAGLGATNVHLKRCRGFPPASAHATAHQPSEGTSQ